MPDSNLLIDVLRPDDLLFLQIECANLTLDTAAGHAPRLVRNQPGQPAYLIVHFPPQHILEEVFTESTDHQYPGLKKPPVKAVLAGRSRLVFKLPDALQALPFTLHDLLDWSRFEAQPASGAIAPADLPSELVPGPAPHAPGNLETAIELPYRIVLSPDRTGRWTHTLEPANHNGLVELWHTRLGTPRTPQRPGVDTVDDRVLPPVRAVWSPDLDAPKDPFDVATLHSDDRRKIVALSSDLSRPTGTISVFGATATIYYRPPALDVERFMLSALGGWLRLQGTWNFPDAAPAGPFALDITGWRHIAAMGRDQYVRVVKKGFLFPFGHRASLTVVSERLFRTDMGIPWTAYLAQRSYITVQEPVKDYRTLSDAYTYKGREMPLKSARLTTLITPTVVMQSQPSGAQLPMIECSGATPEPFRFHLLTEDWEGNHADFTLPMLFVEQGLAADLGKIQQIIAEYTTDTANRQADLRGQNLAFAALPAGKPGRTTLQALGMSFNAQPVANIPAGQAPFLPGMDTANVSIPALASLLATTGSPGTATISLHDAYLKQEPNPGQVFAVIAGNLPIQIPANKGGGLAAPALNAQGLSALMGPVGDVAQIKDGKFAPQDFFKDVDPHLLGGISLKAIIADLSSGFDPAHLDVADLPQDALDKLLADPNSRIPAPVITTRPVYPPNVNPATPGAKPAAVATRLLWKPQIHDLDFFKTSAAETGFAGNARLTLQVSNLTQLDGGGSTSRVEGRLEQFALEFVDIMKVRFAALAFKAEQGQKVDVSAGGVDLEFEGPLSFVNTLKQILPQNGFSDPPSLAVDAEGITAGYSLGIPSAGVGIFSLENIALSAQLALPFVDKPASVRFAISERQHPFLVTVSLFGGGGFFALGVDTQKHTEVEAAIEFGGNLSLNLGVASGGVHVMAGIYFHLEHAAVQLTGYLRCGGELEVLGIVCISVEFYLGLTYDSGRDKVWGQATLTVSVSVACFSKSVALTVEREFAGSRGDPSFDQLVEASDWEQYCAAFA